MRAWWCVLGVLVSACAETSSDFKPYSATSAKRPMTERAVFAYVGDVSRLHEADGEFVGTIEVAGNGFAERADVRDRALVEAASQGGTHVFISGEQANTAWVKLSNDRAVTTFRGNTATTTFRPGAVVPITTHAGNYVVVRVPAENWRQLPRQLRPHPNQYAAHRIAESKRERRAETADAQQTNWYCQAAPNAERCQRDEAGCAADASDVTCEAESIAFCFSSQTPGDAAGQSEGVLECYATLEGCRAARDATFARGARIANECAESR